MKLTRRVSSSYTPHNTVKLIRGGKPYFDLLEKMISQAQHIIHFQVYIFDEDETGKKVISALIEAAKRKVKIYLMVDGYASQHLSGETILRIKEAGIHFTQFEPLLKSEHFYLGRRMHHKIITVDGVSSLIGGLNISDRYNDTAQATAWLDWALYAEGDVVPIVDDVCKKKIRKHLNKAERKQLSLSATDLPGVKENCEVRVRINDWVRRKAQITQSYLEMFRTASSHIIIMSPYFLPGYEFRKRMRLAITRGIKIQIILTGVSDIAIAKYAERFMYRWLFKNKIEVYEYQKNVLHGKMGVCDGQWMTVGSYNINNVSAYASVELNMDVKNEAFALHSEKQLRDIIKKDCVRVTEEFYNQHTSWYQRLLQRAAYNIFRFTLFLFTFYFRQGE